MRCRRKFNLWAAKVPVNQDMDDVFIAPPVPLISNSAHLQKFSCNSGVVVPVRLLAIEESIPCEVEVCEYNSPHYNGAVCIFSHNQFAHLYIGTKINNASIQHSVIALVESTKMGKYDDLIKVLCRTVNWLNIENERPYFYIYYHGKKPAFNTGLIYARNYITRELKSRLKNYKKDEKFCETLRVVKTVVRDFTISGSNPYQFNVS